MSMVEFTFDAEEFQRLMGLALMFISGFIFGMGFVLEIYTGATRRELRRLLGR